MAKYLLLLGGADLDKRSGNIAGPILARYFSWMRDVEAKGHLVGSHKLHDKTGARLSVRGGQVVEAPFIESKEAIGGLFVIEAASLTEATNIARSCPVLDLQNGTVEIRPIEEVSRPAT